MAIIDYDTWMADTARFGMRRSTELQAVDAAFLEYAKLGTGQALQGLQRAFDAWARTQGPGEAWRNSSRNHKRAVDKLVTLLAGGQDDDTAFHMGRVPDFMHEDLINARLGVLYLFSRLSVAPGLFKMTLEGGFNIAKLGMSVGNASQADKANFKTASKYKTQVGMIGSKIESKITDRIFSRSTPQNQSLPAGAPPSLDLATPVETTSEEIEQQAARASTLVNQPGVAPIAEKLQEWFQKLVDKVLDFLRSKFGTVAGVAATIKKVLLAILGVVAKEAVPFVSSGLNLAKAVGETISSAVTRFQTWAEARKVEIAQGHPATVVDSISRAMTLSLLQGLWSTLKGAGGIAMQATSFGGAAIVNMVIAASELLIKFVWKLVETVRFNRFCDEARGYWENQGTDGLHRRPFAFSEWYRAGALNLPLIAVLTLNTGICGDKMRYLTMFRAGGEPITSDAFQAGVRFLDNLKAWGSDYIKGSGFKIMSAGDVLVDRLVHGFATSHGTRKTGFDYVMEAITA